MKHDNVFPCFDKYGNIVFVLGALWTPGFATFAAARP